MLLKRVNMDIAYLLRCFSFGVRKGPVRPVDTGITHLICNTPVKVYYYTAKNQMIYTPAGIHTSYSTKYEGPHHPMCKINLYPDYIFNEGGIKWKGSTVVFSTENTNNNNPKEYNDEMLLGVLVACIYSLLQRLHFYIHLIEDLDQIIDRGHTMAPKYTYDTINLILQIIKDPQIKQCSEDFMERFQPFNLNNLMILFDEIKLWSNDHTKQRKEWILNFYHTKEYTKQIPVTVVPQTIKPRKLF